MKMESKKIVGLEVHTSNQEGKATTDIPALWESFYTKQIPSKITNKVSNKVYGVYTRYEGDHTQPYSLIVGCEVTSPPESLPEGCIYFETQPIFYKEVPLNGDFPLGLIEAWQSIWTSDMPRSYTNDYEVYDETFNPSSGKSEGVSLYIAVQE